MIRKISCFLFALCFIFLSSCASVPALSAELYAQAFDHIYDKNFTINENIQYVAVDFNSIKGLSDSQKSVLITHIKEVTRAEVCSKSFSNLKNDGSISGSFEILKNGFLVYVERYFKISSDTISFSLIKYKSKKLAVSIKYTFLRKNGKWIMSENSTQWVY